MTTIIGVDPSTTHERACDHCGAPFRVRPCEVRKAQARGYQPPRFCSSDCQHEAYRGPGNPKWRGGLTVNGSGYVYEYAPDHPHATADGYVMQHRLVKEAEIGRLLTPEERSIGHRRRFKTAYCSRLCAALAGSRAAAEARRR